MTAPEIDPWSMPDYPARVASGHLTDAQATTGLHAALNLAIVLRDEVGATVIKAAQDLLKTVGGDPIAAVCVAAALIRVDEGVDAWWNPPADARPADAPALSQGRVKPSRQLKPCGTHAAFVRHKYHREEPCDACDRGEALWQHERQLRRYRPTRPPSGLAS